MASAVAPLPMKSILLSYFVAAFVFGGGAMAAVAGPPVGASVSRLFVDRVDAGAVLNWEGGDLRAEAIAAAGLGVKQLGPPRLAPLVVRVAFPPSAVLAGWITEVAAGGATRRTLVLTDSDAMQRTAEGYEVTGAMLSEIVFPKFDAAAATFDPMTLVFSGERGGAVVTVPQAVVGPAPKAITGFQLSVAGLDGKGVSRIESFTIKQGAPTAPNRGEEIMRHVGAGPTEISNLRITLSRATVPTWRTWHSDFVVNGTGPGATKREGVIGLLGPSGQPGPLSLVLTGCGILSLSRPPETAGVPVKYVAEMFVERIAFAGLPPAVGGPKLVVEREPPPAEKKEPAPGAGSPADKGMRDPAEFPRVADLVRLTYSGNYGSNYTSEQATYSAAEAANSLLARVTDAAKGAGWELRTLDENESAGSRQIHQRWVRENAGATLTISEKAEVKGSQMLLQVYVTIPAK